MIARKLVFAVAAFAAAMVAAGPAWGLGFELGESKEKLKLDYEVKTTDHGTGRVTIEFTLADEGRLKPLSSIDLMIPAQDGSGHVDLSVSLDAREVDGKRVAAVHIARELAERAQIHLNTRQLDGKELPLTWYYHVVPLADSIKPAR